MTTTQNIDRHLAMDLRAEQMARHLAETSQIITCNCTLCKGRSAKVVASTGRRTPTMIHNLVCIAYSPLANAASGKKFGPWPIVDNEWRYVLNEAVARQTARSTERPTLYTLPHV
jgi:hypothetical protein